MKKHPDYCLRPQVKGNAVETRSLLKLISVVWRPYCAVFMLGALKKKPRVHSVIALVFLIVYLLEVRALRRSKERTPGFSRPLVLFS